MTPRDHWPLKRRPTVSLLSLHAPCQSWRSLYALTSVSSSVSQWAFVARLYIKDIDVPLLRWTTLKGKLRANVCNVLIILLKNYTPNFTGIFHFIPLKFISCWFDLESCAVSDAVSDWGLVLNMVYYVLAFAWLLSHAVYMLICNKYMFSFQVLNVDSLLMCLFMCVDIKENIDSDAFTAKLKWWWYIKMSVFDTSLAQYSVTQLHIWGITSDGNHDRIKL